MFIINTQEGPIDIDNPEARQACYNEMMENASFNPWSHCPNCDSNKVYGNGTDAIELACPDCGMQYNPSNY